MALDKFSHIDFHKKGFRTIRTPFFLVKLSPNGLTHHRIAIVISKSAIKKAVERNFWKRQTRDNLLGFKGCSSDILVIINNKTASLSKLQFKEEIKKALL